MRYKHTSRPGFLLGFIDFFTAGIFFLLYMPFGGLQDELEDILGHKVMPYWKAYLLGISTLLIYSMFEPIKLWIPLLVINAGAWMGIIRLFLRNERDAKK